MFFGLLAAMFKKTQKDTVYHCLCVPTHTTAYPLITSHHPSIPALSAGEQSEAHAASCAEFQVLSGDLKTVGTVINKDKKNVAEVGGLQQEPLLPQPLAF